MLPAHSTRVTALFVILSLLLSSAAPAFAAPSAKDPSPLIEVSGVDANLDNDLSDAAPPTDPNPRETRAAVKFIENQDLIVEQVFEMVAKLEAKTKEKRAELGDDKFEDLVEKGKDKDALGYQEEGVGKAELTAVKPSAEEKAVIITRVVHEATGIAFLVIDSRISMDSAHLRQLIARQHLEANDFKGRPVLVLQIDSKTLAEPGAPGIHDQLRANDGYDVHYKPKPTTVGEKWREWKDATWVKPTGWDFALSQFCALGQVGITCGMGELQKVLDPAHAKPYWHAAALSYIFATAIGTFSSTWRNWTNRGTPRQQTLKAATLSVAFAYGLTLWDGGMNGMKSLLLMDPNGMLTTASVLAGLSLQFNVMSNIWVNNLTKNYWSEFSRIRERMGLSRGMLDVKIPFTGKVWHTGIKRTSWESQMIAFGPYTLKLAALTGFFISIPLMGHIDAGKIAFWSSMFWVQYATVRYALKHHYEKLPQLRERWVKFPPVRFASYLGRAAKNVALAVAGGVENARAYCESLLTGGKPKPKDDDVDGPPSGK